MPASAPETRQACRRRGTRPHEKRSWPLSCRAPVRPAWRVEPPPRRHRREPDVSSVSVARMNPICSGRGRTLRRGGERCWGPPTPNSLGDLTHRCFRHLGRVLAIEKKSAPPSRLADQFDHRWAPRFLRLTRMSKWKVAGPCFGCLSASEVRRYEKKIAAVSTATSNRRLPETRIWPLGMLES